MTTQSPFTLLGVHQGPPNEPILYRIRLSQAPIIRYLTAPTPPQGASGIPDYRGDLLSFDTVPSGTWNLGRLIVSEANPQKFVLASTETADLVSVLNLVDAGPVWSPQKFELVNLLDEFYAHRDSQPESTDNDDDSRVELQCLGHLSALVLPTPASLPASIKTVVGISAWQPGPHAHALSAESHIYRLIHSNPAQSTLAPRFLGHIVDNLNDGTHERVIGFLLEHIPNAREAGPQDLKECREALGRLHALRVAYGRPLGKGSFLVCGEGEGKRVLMQGFACAFEMEGDEEGGEGREETMSRELAQLEEALNQPSELERRNKPVDPEESEQWLAFLGHGMVHPFVHWLKKSGRHSEEGGKVPLTVEQHRELVEELAANGYRWGEEDLERVKGRFGF